MPYKGPLSALILQLVGGLRSGMGYVGCTDIKTLQERARFVKAMRRAYAREFYVGTYRVFENDERAVSVRLADDTPAAFLASPPRVSSAFEIVAQQRRVERWP